MPHLKGVVVERIERQPARVCIRARTPARGGRCTKCGVLSDRVHSRYTRELADSAISAQRVVLRLRVRRLFCDNNACAAKTFAEQVVDLTQPYARRTTPLRRTLEEITLALAGRPGARLANSLGLAVSRDSLLRMLRALPDPPTATVTVLGIDDFATKRGQVYATILIDHHTRRPIEVLPNRDADTLAAWLTTHPEVQIITRDRAGAYAEAANRGAPQTTQCADRWHLWKNLGQAVEKTVIAHRASLHDPTTPNRAQPDDTDPQHQCAREGRAREQAVTTALTTTPGAAKPNTQSRLQARFQQRYTQIHALRDQGKGMRTIADELGLDRKTIRRFLDATSVEHLLAKTTSRTTVLDNYKPYLHQRWTQGTTNVPQLISEIRAQGYRGSTRTVYRYLRPSQAERNPPPPTPAPPTIRAVTGWIMGNPDNLADQDHQRLQQILTRCPELEATRRHVSSFAHMIRDLRGDLLPEWINRVREDNLPALHSFTTGLQHDHAAVIAGLTLPYNNGPTEGTVNKIKMIKRSMYGRANFDLLRKRVLLTA